MANELPGPRGSSLEWLASAVLDGDPVDWAAVESTTPHEMHGLILQLRTLHLLTQFHRNLPDEAGPETAPPTGTMWGHLRIDQRIGTGAFGEVFRAWDTRLAREVALKLLRPEAWPDADTTGAVIAEGRLLARVRHPNVVTVYGAERIDGRVGLWMELVHGRTLADEVASGGPLEAADAIAIARDLCHALSAVHDAGLVHCDVKAQNVVREEGGRIVLMDFGAGAESWAGAAPAAGTPLYAAPEVLNGAAVSVRSDLYSLGVLLYFLLTGDYPVRGASVSEIRAAHGTTRLQFPKTVPRKFARLVAQALDADPLQRPETAAAMAAAVERAGARPPYLWLAGATAAVAAAALVVWPGLSRTPARLSGGGASAPAGMTSVQRVPVPPYLLLGRPSLDGGRLSYAEVEGHVAALDLATFESRRIASAARGEMAEFSAMSPDGAQVAYQWLTPDDEYQLRIAPVWGGEPRVVLAAGASEYPIPLEWSNDMSQLLMLLWRTDGARDLSLVATADGRERTLRRFTGPVPFSASLSPDGRFVVFDHPPGSDLSTRDIFVLDVDTGDTRLLITHRATDLFPSWTPDGSAVFFVSDRAGTMDGWIQPVAGGAPEGEPRVVARNLGRVSPLGFTRDGTYYYLARTGLIDVFTATWGADGRVGAAAKLPSGFEGASAQPAWSPDGRFLAYIGLRGPVAGDRGAHVLVIRDVTTGAERELAQDLSFALPAPRWSPDGAEVLLRGSDARNRWSYFRIDVRTGTVTPTMPVDGSMGAAYDWSRDGHAILYVHHQQGLQSYDLASGQVRTMLAAARGGVTTVHRFGEAPESGDIAYSGVAAGTDTGTLRVIDAMGRLRELVRGEPGEHLVFHCWSPDGRYVFFTRFRPGGAEPHELWMASRDGLEVRPLDFRIAGWTQANGVAVHPGGTEIAFTGGEASWELWRLENFLSSDARWRF